MMEIIAESPEYPVEYDDERRAYFLSGLQVGHCIFCGGKLPDPIYPESPDPDPREEQEAIAIVQSARSLDHLLQILGAPDDLSSWEDDDFTKGFARLAERYPDQYVDDPNDRWTRYVRYMNRWSTFYLEVYEYPDGRLAPAITGKHPDERFPPRDRPWWHRMISKLTKTT